MNKIAAALVAAQKLFGPALKTSTNPHFKSKYADLSACVEAVIDGLNQSGIALIQVTHESPDGVIVETIFLHESGEQFSAGKLYVPVEKKTCQGFGSALTYCRRYSLLAATGLAPESDDGNLASQSSPRPPVKTQAPPAVNDLSGHVVTDIDALKGKKLSEIDTESLHRIREDYVALYDDDKSKVTPDVMKELKIIKMYLVQKEGRA